MLQCIFLLAVKLFIISFTVMFFSNISAKVFYLLVTLKLYKVIKNILIVYAQKIFII